MHFYWLISILVIFPSKQHEIVSGTSLELLVGDSLEVLCVILTNARIVSTDHDIPSFIS
jgi:hypothetical protein